MDKVLPERGSGATFSAGIAKRQRRLAATQLSGVRFPLPAPKKRKALKMKNVNKLFMIILIVALFILAGIYSANAANQLANGYIYLPNGQTLDVRNLTDQEIQKAVELATKAMDIPRTDKVIDAVKGINPEELDQWRKVVTGTVKDICNDLSITVNEFVKTPVGFGIGLIVFYKYMGKDLFENALDILIVTPLWFILTGMILYCGWYFFHCKTVYEYRTVGDKTEKVNPKRVTAYAWEEKTDKSYLAATLIAAQAFITFVGLILVLP